MKINVRNMVCNNCVGALERLLRQLGFDVKEIGLGYAVVDGEALTAEQRQALVEGLPSLGFELIENRDEQLVESVKHEILRHINGDEPCHLNLSHCLAHATGHDYKSLSRIFSTHEGRTIEKFYVAAKVEKVKELLSYGDIPLSEIAYRLGYSSVAFLSRQFKQETGLTPSQFRTSPTPRRPLASI